jgi:hypothetical protein
MENEITRINQDNGRRLGGLLQSSNKTNQSLDETNRRLAMQNDMFSNFFRSFSKDSRKDEGNIAEEKKEAAVRERNRIASEKAALQRENSLTKYFKSGKGSVGGAGGDGAVPVSIQSLGPGLGAAGGLFGGIIKGVLKAVLAVGGFYLVLKNMPLIIEGFKKIKDFINPTDKDGKTRFDKIGEYLSGVMESAIKSLSSTVMKIFTPLIADISYRFGVLSAIFETIKNSLVEKLEILIEKFKLGLAEVGLTIENFFNEKVLPPFKSISKSLEKFIGFFENIFGKKTGTPLDDAADELLVNRNNKELSVSPSQEISEQLGKQFKKRLADFNEEDSQAAKEARKRDIEKDEPIQKRLQNLNAKKFALEMVPAINPIKVAAKKAAITLLDSLIAKTEEKLDQRSEYAVQKQRDLVDLRNEGITDILLNSNTMDANNFDRRMEIAKYLELKKVLPAGYAENAGLSKEEIAQIHALNDNANFNFKEKTTLDKLNSFFTPKMEESKKYIDKKLEDIGEEGENLKELVKALIKPSTAAPVNVTPINYSEDNSDTSQRYSFISSDSSPFDRYGKPIKEVFA